MLRANLLVSHHDSVGYERGSDLAPSKPSPIQSLDGFLCRIDGVELQVDLALVSRSAGDTNRKKKTYLAVFFDFNGIDFAVLLLAFTFDIVSKVLIPITLCFSVKKLACLRRLESGGY